MARWWLVGVCAEQVTEEILSVPRRGRKVFMGTYQHHPPPSSCVDTGRVSVCARDISLNVKDQKSWVLQGRRTNERPTEREGKIQKRRSLSESEHMNAPLISNCFDEELNGVAGKSQKTAPSPPPPPE